MLFLEPMKQLTSLIRDFDFPNTTAIDSLHLSLHLLKCRFNLTYAAVPGFPLPNAKPAYKADRWQSLPGF